MTIIEWTLLGLLCGGSIVGMLWLTWTILTKKERKFIKLMKVYLGLSISGRDYESVVQELEQKKSILRTCGYEVFSPMTGKAYLRNELVFKASGYNNPVSTNHAICERDFWMVQQSDILFMDFSNCGNITSIGMVAELAVGAFLRKHTVCVIPDVNIHNHAFVLEMADIVFKTVDEAYEYFKKLIAQEM